MPDLSHTAPLAITMGEPAGIGPELTAQLWRDRVKHNLSPFLYVGAVDALANVPTVPVKDPNEALVVFGNALPVFDIPLASPITPGVPAIENGASVVRSIQQAVKFCQEGKCSGLVTSPIHKAALYKAGFDAPGHTEYLARLAKLPDNYSIMMLATEELRVVPVTVHVPIMDVPTHLTSEQIFHAGMVTAGDLKTRFGIQSPRLAVAGLNPHAGESGTIGMEEATHILPAIWQLRDQGIDVTDPLPADTLFHEEARAKYDAVLCMYHDQALIPIKTLDFWGGVNVTLGLPFIRTSPDHGTALELAGTGTARTDSMLAAIKMAEKMVITEQGHG